MKLRRNWAVQEVVDVFVAARPTVLGLARGVMAAEQNGMEEDGIEERPAKKKRKVGTPTAEAGEPVGEEGNGRQTRSRSKRTETPAPTVEVVEDSQDEEYLPGMLLSTFFVCD